MEELNGVGEKTAEALSKAGIFSVRDFFYYLPRDYENYTNVVRISEVRPGKVTIRGKVRDISTRWTRRRNLSVTEATIYDETEAIRAVWFNQAYRAKQMNEKDVYLFSGEYEISNGRYQLMNPRVREAGGEAVSRGASGRPVVTGARRYRSAVACAMPAEQPLRPTALTPIYPQRGRLKSEDFQRLFEKNRARFGEVPDLLPEISEETRGGERARALFSLHFPEKEEEVARGRGVLAYEELFEFILAARLNKNEMTKQRAEAVPFSLLSAKDFLSGLPFELTPAQKKAAWEIIKDMGRETPMNRLLQGDVGSGKTVVAAMAILQAVRAGFQVAFLAPTSVLAQQHYATLTEAFLGHASSIKIALLTGAEKKKDEVKRKIREGEVDVVVGTHAILTDDTTFLKLRLCIIDEQHRFGVNQRQKLLLKSGGVAPHLLSMTATPIPRSLQLTLFGDLDVSVINQMPKGRQKVETKIITGIEVAEELYPKIIETAQRGEQIYYICRLIEDKSESLSVKKEVLRLQERFPKMKIAALHGKMKPEEKDRVLAEFSSGKIDMLVSTTVVEVGVNVPNATMMVIRDAEHYGLAQLHQLRGRVGRGKKKSACFLVSEGENKPSRRLLELTRSNDGFHLSEIDLELRGPGEIYGALQHGAASFSIASITDTRLISRVQKDVMKFLPEYLKNPEKYVELNHIIKKYQTLTTLN